MPLIFFPTPDEQGIAETKELVALKYGRAVTDEEAARLLRGVMEHMYLVRYLDEKLKAQT